ncbi:hypothetical protein AB0F11_33370 [Streptomyces sp. NPDC032472]|uniref:hypothetical protein n=1 Tax=Streptomyces sp. NPDC032472 TaxID=3155018 RepID=UPI0033E12316
MRWERGEDLPVTWTTLDNQVVDDDLSCRALGLLTRWLRRPPGAEIDSIPDMVKRAKREGKQRLEGRDALYAASYELEAAGYLVRELTTGETGQHEWVVRIYNRPVEPSRRSDPEDRKRGARKGAAKPQVSPITGFQESGNQESVSPDSAEPDPGDQASSSKDSVKYSSLSDTPPSQEPQGERDAAAPGGRGGPAASPPPEDPAVRVAAMWARGREAHGLSTAPARLRAFEAEARRMLAGGVEVARLELAAQRMASEATWYSLAKQLDAMPAVPVPAQGPAVRPTGVPREGLSAAALAILAKGSGL